MTPDAAGVAYLALDPTALCSHILALPPAVNTSRTRSRSTGFYGSDMKQSNSCRFLRFAGKARCSPRRSHK